MTLDTLASLWCREDDDPEDLLITGSQDCWKREASLQIKSTKMLCFQKNKWLGVFLDLVQEDLSPLNWTHQRNDNLDPDERQALQELNEGSKLIIKKGDKTGNLVLQKTSMKKK